MTNENNNSNGVADRETLYQKSSRKRSNLGRDEVSKGLFLEESERGSIMFHLWFRWQTWSHQE